MYMRGWKRALDATLALNGLLILAVPMGIISVFIKITSAGPVLFRQERVGRHGRRFVLRKFRTMTVDHTDPSTVTIRGDRRITAFGRFLRRYKMDEFPQLWNVLRGDISFVGPRPDVPGYYDQLRGADRRVLSLRPGITGPATIKYADEESLLAKQEDPVRFNDEMIFPDKVRINLDYLDHCTLGADISWIWRTIGLALKRAPHSDCGD